MTTQPTSATDSRPFGGVFDGKPAAPPEAEQLLITHTSRLKDMADKAEADRDEAALRARAWSDAAETHHRLAAGYRKALEYLEAQARADAARPGDRA